ncbi:hypothetical protein FACS189485_03580 [Spirochaetia bacterium]|nr:hypothetical protein FACS189485_03580 [Spirochaetia bacterium]
MRGLKTLNPCSQKMEEYKSRIKDGLINSDFNEIMELAGTIYDKATMSERERLINTIDLMDKEMRKTTEK